MGGFSFKNITFMLIIFFFLCFSNMDISNARRVGKHWRQSTSLYKKKGKIHGSHHLNGNAGKSKQKAPSLKAPPTVAVPPPALPPPNKGEENAPDSIVYNVLDFGAKGDGKTDDTKERSSDGYFYEVVFILICVIVFFVFPFGLWCWGWIHHRFLSRRRREVLDSLPIVVYGEHAVLSSECPICLDEFAVGDEICVLPQCGHAFHAECIKKWLASHSDCPFCRQAVVAAATTTT